MQSDVKQSRTKAGDKRRSINGRIGLRIPRNVLNAVFTPKEEKPSIERN